MSTDTTETRILPRKKQRFYLYLWKEHRLKFMDNPILNFPILICCFRWPLMFLHWPCVKHIITKKTRVTILDLHAFAITKIILMEFISFLPFMRVLISFPYSSCLYHCILCTTPVQCYPLLNLWLVFPCLYLYFQTKLLQRNTTKQ